MSEQSNGHSVTVPWTGLRATRKLLAEVQRMSEWSRLSAAMRRGLPVKLLRGCERRLLEGRCGRMRVVFARIPSRDPGDEQTEYRLLAMCYKKDLDKKIAELEGFRPADAAADELLSLAECLASAESPSSVDFEPEELVSHSTSTAPPDSHSQQTNPAANPTGYDLASLPAFLDDLAARLCFQEELFDSFCKLEAEVQAQVSACRKDAADRQADFDALAENFATAEIAGSRASESLAQMAQLRGELQTVAVALQAGQADAEAKTIAAEGRFGSLGQQLAALDARLRSIEVQAAEFATRAVSFEGLCSAMSAELDELKTESQRQDRRLADLDRLRDEHAEVREREIARLAADHAAATLHVRELAAQVAAEKRLVDDLHETCGRLAMAVESMRRRRSRSPVSQAADMIDACIEHVSHFAVTIGRLASRRGN